MFYLIGTLKVVASCGLHKVLLDVSRGKRKKRKEKGEIMGIFVAHLLLICKLSTKWYFCLINILYKLLYILYTSAT
jgi:hypothetical protein